MYEGKKLFFGRYALPTPRKWRRIGDACLAVGTAISSTAALSGYTKMAVAAGIITALGKFLTNFFYEK